MKKRHVKRESREREPGGERQLLYSAAPICSDSAGGGSIHSALHVCVERGRQEESREKEGVGDGWREWGSEMGGERGGGGLLVISPEGDNGRGAQGQWLPCSTLPAQLANQERALPARRTHKRRTLQQRHRRRLQEELGILHTEHSRTTTPSPGHTLLGITASLFSEPSPTPLGEKTLPHHHPEENPFLLIFTLQRTPTNLQGLRFPW